MMTPQDKELCQEKILQQCHNAGRFGTPEATLLRGLHKSGFEEADAKDLERDLRYLESKGWIRTVERELRPDLRKWQTTAPGDEYLMKQGLI